MRSPSTGPATSSTPARFARSPAGSALQIIGQRVLQRGILIDLDMPELVVFAALRDRKPRIGAADIADQSQFVHGKLPAGQSEGGTFIKRMSRVRVPRLGCHPKTFIRAAAPHLAFDLFRPAQLRQIHRLVATQCGFAMQGQLARTVGALFIRPDGKVLLGLRAPTRRPGPTTGTRSAGASRMARASRKHLFARRGKRSA